MKPAPPVIKAVRGTPFMDIFLPCVWHDAQRSIPTSLRRETEQSEFLKHGLCLVIGVLFHQPLGEFSEALFIADLRFVSEQTPCLREIGIAVANITSAVFVRDRRFNVFAQKTSKYLRNFTN